MTRDELRCEYFEWIYRLVCGATGSGRRSYRKVLRRLDDIDFTYTISTDGNRAEDGVDLRYRFGYESSYAAPIISSLLDDRPCSVLEMMTALALRCEEHIMADPDKGDRVGEWFWVMMTSLGLASMSDSEYDKKHVDSAVNKLLNRKYERNGRGGLFTVAHCRRDMRSVEIWYQMCWYLDGIL